MRLKGGWRIIYFSKIYQGNKPLGKPGQRQEKHITMVLKETACRADSCGSRQTAAAS
jgi:hypothetical protein